MLEQFRFFRKKKITSVCLTIFFLFFEKVKWKKNYDIFSNFPNNYCRFINDYYFGYKIYLQLPHHVQNVLQIYRDVTQYYHERSFNFLMISILELLLFLVVIKRFISQFCTIKCIFLKKHVQLTKINVCMQIVAKVGMEYMHEVEMHNLFLRRKKINWRKLPTNEAQYNWTLVKFAKKFHKNKKCQAFRQKTSSTKHLESQTSLPTY